MRTSWTNETTDMGSRLRFDCADRIVFVTSSQTTWWDASDDGTQHIVKKHLFQFVLFHALPQSLLCMCTWRHSHGYIFHTVHPILFSVHTLHICFHDASKKIAHFFIVSNKTIGEDHSVTPCTQEILAPVSVFAMATVSSPCCIIAGKWPLKTRAEKTNIDDIFRQISFVI